MLPIVAAAAAAAAAALQSQARVEAQKCDN